MERTQGAQAAGHRTAGRRQVVGLELVVHHSRDFALRRARGRGYRRSWAGGTGDKAAVGRKGPAVRKGVAVRKVVVGRKVAADCKKIAGHKEAAEVGRIAAAGRRMTAAGEAAAGCKNPGQSIGRHSWAGNCPEGSLDSEKSQLMAPRSTVKEGSGVPWLGYCWPSPAPRSLVDRPSNWL